ncbi:hypothetical protein [uncultured Rhodoblastus sp.]|uniref:hypothetical protein n=1 Tax=uncultured Rhodoblastus sp. TaxID=543037 RepID=UPI0025E9E74C|nr:hypothetical protein [uncultured Rhodoblastus sp.]
MSVWSKIVQALLRDDATPSIYFSLVSREYNAGPRMGETSRQVSHAEGFRPMRRFSKA